MRAARLPRRLREATPLGLRPRAFSAPLTVAVFAARGPARYVLAVLLGTMVRRALLRRRIRGSRRRGAAGARDRYADQLFDRPQIRHFVGTAVRDCCSRGTGARSAADAVHVAFRLVGQI